eukprot:gb/GECH01011515.1/.p1 GENE.gb/GECH01011515.1/~~gb/GECH01011515.1/.p1  ORF type:complete len:376 (+),score=50.86 gb/GECH01011515.1/:1-1128(+)
MLRVSQKKRLLLTIAACLLLFIVLEFCITVTYFFPYYQHSTTKIAQDFTTKKEVSKQQDNEEPWWTKTKSKKSMFGSRPLPQNMLPKVRSKYENDPVVITPPLNEDYPAYMQCVVPRNRQPRIQNCRWLVLIVSMLPSVEQRKAIRETWIATAQKNMNDVCYRFVIGQPLPPSNDEDKLNLVLEEDNIHQDILWLNHTEDYFSLTEKTIHALASAQRGWDVDYILKTDDDSYIRMDKLRQWMEDPKHHIRHPQQQCIYAGRMRQYSGPIRKNIRVSIAPREWPFDRFPPFGPGAGYILSAACVNELIHRCESGGIPYLRLEDAAIGIILNNTIPNLRRISTYRISNKPICESNTILCHHLSPQKLRHVHEQYNTS